MLYDPGMSILSISAPKFQNVDIFRPVGPKEFITAPKTLEFSGKYFQGQILKYDPKRSYNKVVHTIL